MRKDHYYWKLGTREALFRTMFPDPEVTKQQLLDTFPVSWKGLQEKARRMGLERSYASHLPGHQETSSRKKRVRRTVQQWHAYFQEEYGLDTGPFPFRDVHESLMRGETPCVWQHRQHNLNG